MHIAHFIQRFPPALGGSEAYFQRLSRDWIARDHRVTVWTTNALDLSAFWSPAGRTLPAGSSFEDGFEVRRYPLWRMRGRRWLLKPLSLLPLRTWQAMTLPCNPISVSMWRAAASDSQQYDAVHATAFPYAWPIACALRLARRQRIPFCLTPFLHLGDPHDPLDRTRRQYTQPALVQFLRAADAVFVQTTMERDAVIRLGVDVDRVVLQGLGVDVPECTGGDRTAVRLRWNIAADDVVIGHLANLSMEKGSVDLVLAAEALQRDRDQSDAGHSRVTVVLAGPCMPNFDRWLAQTAPAVRVVRTGILNESEKRDFYAGIDLFALPSRSDSFGLVLLEAWANGVPVVAARAGGPAELVRHGVDGLLARPGDPLDLARHLKALVDSTELRRRLGGAGLARCEFEFQWDAKLQIVRDAITQLKQKRPWRSQSTRTATVVSDLESSTAELLGLQQDLGSAPAHLQE